MEPNTVRGSRTPGTNRFFGMVGLVVAGAVLVGGVAALAGSTLQAAESDPVAGVSSTPFTFDSPTATLERVKPSETAERSTARADTLALEDWKFTQAQLTEAESYFLAGVLIVNPQFFAPMLIMVTFPGFSDFVASVADDNFFLQLAVIDAIGTLLLKGVNPLLPVAPPPPVSPTT